MRLLAILFLSFILTGCIKDKLVNQSRVFIGTWKYDHSIEYTYDQANDSIIGTVIPGSNFADTYEYQFLEKGKVFFIKNGEVEKKNRIILSSFKSGLCDLENGYSYEIKLNNDDADLMIGCVNEDTLICTRQTHLPLETGIDYPYYEHVFLKSN